MTAANPKNATCPGKRFTLTQKGSPSVRGILFAASEQPQLAFTTSARSFGQLGIFTRMATGHDFGKSCNNDATEKRAMSNAPNYFGLTNELSNELRAFISDLQRWKVSKWSPLELFTLLTHGSDIDRKGSVERARAAARGITQPFPTISEP